MIEKNRLTSFLELEKLGDVEINANMYLESILTSDFVVENDTFPYPCEELLPPTLTVKLVYLIVMQKFETKFAFFGKNTTNLNASQIISHPYWAY